MATEQKNECSGYFGFLISNPDYEDEKYENEIYKKIMNLVNDLNRENLTVYWITQNMTVSVFNIYRNITQNKEFREGFFIVPFIGEIDKDTKIINMINNYNTTHEIESNSKIKLPIYLINENLDISCYKLKNVKIIEYKNYLTCTENWYQHTAFLCGFFDFDVFDTCEIAKKINNDDYNLVICPAYDCYYPASFACTEILIDLYSKRTNEVRRFVRNGGGYVGSCYGQYMASAGTSPIYMKRKALNPELNSYGFLALQDTKTTEGETVYYLEQLVEDKDHAVSTAIDEYILGWYGSGPKVTYAGGTVDVVIRFFNSNSLDNAPSVVASEFGSGKVVSIGPHPEISDFDTDHSLWDLYIRTNHLGKRLVVNSFLYTTSEQTSSSMQVQYDFDTINNIKNINLDLNELLDNEGNYLSEQINTLSGYLDTAYEINETITSTMDKVKNIANNEKINLSESGKFLHYAAVEYSLYDSEYLIYYLEKNIENLETLQKVMFLFKDDEESMTNFSNFKDNLNENIGKVNYYLEKIKNNFKQYNKVIDRYSTSRLLKFFYSKRAEINGYHIENDFTSLNVFLSCFISSEIIKTLRSSWIDFELLNSN